VEGEGSKEPGPDLSLVCATPMMQHHQAQFGLNLALWAAAPV